MDFSKFTPEQIDALDKEFIEKLSWGDFITLYERNKELGRGYLFGGKMSAIGGGQPVYARDNISLEKKQDGTWGIWVGMCGPDFIEKPKIIDEKTFIKCMLDLGVTQEKLDEFLKYKVNWDDF